MQKNEKAKTQRLRFFVLIKLLSNKSVPIGGKAVIAAVAFGNYIGPDKLCGNKLKLNILVLLHSDDPFVRYIFKIICFL